MTSGAIQRAGQAYQVSSFDFLNGVWRARERYLENVGQGSTNWRERSAILVARPLLGGLANAEEITFPDDPGLSVATFRSLDLTSREWVIQSYVYASRNNADGAAGDVGMLTPPLRGRFVDGRGEFLGSTQHEGREVALKYVWCDITPSSAQWERWFSFDEGKTWEQNVAWSQTRERTLS